VLQPEPEATATLRSCTRQQGAPAPGLEIGRARGIRLKHSHDVDFTAFDAQYVYQGAVWGLSSMTGVLVGGWNPAPDWVAGLSAFAIRSIKCGEYRWFDLRGTSADGLLSRWVGYGFSYVEYSKVPPPVARVFDKAIDTGCCR
jgi:hypothetical protein